MNDPHPFDAGPNVVPPSPAAHSYEPLDRLHDDIVRLTRAMEDEATERANRKNTKQYLDLEETIRKATEERDALLADIPNSAPALEEAKQSMMALLRLNGMIKYKNVIAKMGKRSVVNVSRLLHVLGGDVGIVLEMAKVTQTQLKSFADTMPHIKQELMGCVESEGVMKDLELGFNFDTRSSHL